MYLLLLCLIRGQTKCVQVAVSVRRQRQEAVQVPGAGEPEGPPCTYFGPMAGSNRNRGRVVAAASYAF